MKDPPVSRVRLIARPQLEEAPNRAFQGFLAHGFVELLNPTPPKQNSQVPSPLFKRAGFAQLEVCISSPCEPCYAGHRGLRLPSGDTTEC